MRKAGQQTERAAGAESGAQPRPRQLGMHSSKARKAPDRQRDASVGVPRLAGRCRKLGSHRSLGGDEIEGWVSGCAYVWPTFRVRKG